MKLELQIDGTWLAQGDGPLRPVLAEGDTRVTAMYAYVGAVASQITEEQARDKIDWSDFKWAWEEQGGDV